MDEQLVHVMKGSVCQKSLIPQQFRFCVQRIDVRFIEYMPFGGNHFSKKKFIDYRTLLAAIEGRYNGQVQRLSDAPNDTTKVKRLFLYFFVVKTLFTKHQFRLTK